MIIPTDAYEVFDIWADPTNQDYESGGAYCANFAAQRYANVTFDEAKQWDLEFKKYGYDDMFHHLNDAYDRYVAYTFLAGQDDNDEEDRPLRDADDPILRVAQAFGKNPELYQLIVEEDEDGMLYVELTNQADDRFTFTILEDYEMFWAFKRYRDAVWRKRAIAAKKASADKFLAKLP